MTSNNVYFGGAIVDGSKMRERHKWDFYPTPWGVIETAKDLVHKEMDYWDYTRLLDLGAGTGRWTRVFKDNNPELLKTTAIEQNYACLPALGKVGVSVTLPYDLRQIKPDFQGRNGKTLIVSNPPFKYFNQFWEWGVDFLRPGEGMMFFARLQALTTASRVKLFEQHGYPEHVWIFENRVSFYPEGHPAWSASGKSKTGGQDHVLMFYRKTIKRGYSMFTHIKAVNDDNPGKWAGVDTYTDMVDYGLYNHEYELEKVNK